MMETLNSPSIFLTDAPAFRTANANALKNSLKLDFSSGSKSAKKQQLQQQQSGSSSTPYGILASPDLNKLQMASPELERMIIGQHGLATGLTPTPSTYIQVPASSSTKSVTEEQEQFARGFYVALEQIQKSGGSGILGGLSGQTVTVVDSAKAGPLPSDFSGSYNLMTLTTAPKPPSDSLPPSSHSLTRPMLSVQGIPRPVDLTQSQNSAQTVEVKPSISALASSQSSIPSATLVTSLPGTVLTFSQHLPLQQSQLSSSQHYSHYSQRFETSRQQHSLSQSHPAILSSLSSLKGLEGAPRPLSASSVIPQTVLPYDRLMQIKAESDGASMSSCSSPPPSMSPINMEAQEQIKLERKRERNRLAATKCRKRKLDRISELEGRVKELKDSNSELSKAANELRAQVSEYKRQIMEHRTHGCSVVIQDGLL